MQNAFSIGTYNCSLPDIASCWITMITRGYSILNKHEQTIKAISMRQHATVISNHWSCQVSKVSVDKTQVGLSKIPERLAGAIHAVIGFLQLPSPESQSQCVRVDIRHYPGGSAQLLPWEA